MAIVIRIRSVKSQTDGAESLTVKSVQFYGFESQIMLIIVVIDNEPNQRTMQQWCVYCIEMTFRGNNYGIITLCVRSGSILQ